MDIARKLAIPALLLCSGAGLVHAQENVRIVNEGGIGDQWLLAEGAQLVAPGYPEQFVERGDNVCLAMGYAIKPDGSTSDFSLLKSWTSSTGNAEPVTGFWETFAQAGANALSQWRFQPRPEVDAPIPTYTVATLIFTGGTPVDADSIREHCRVEDLAALVAQNNAEQQSRYRSVEQRDRESMMYRATPQRESADTPVRSAPPQP